MTSPHFPEDLDEEAGLRDENRREWLDVVQQREADEGDQSASEIMPGDMALSEAEIDDDGLYDEVGITIIDPTDAIDRNAFGLSGDPHDEYLDDDEDEDTTASDPSI